MTFADELRKWRGERTRGDAAKLLGVSPRTLEGWEQSHRTPNELTQSAVRERMRSARIAGKREPKRAVR